jgi:deoxyadenosine/deoxycytidine kinase
MRIEIAGSVGVGKSTLSKALSDSGCHVVYEDVTGNPYLELQTIDPDRYAFLAQQTFIEDKIGVTDDAIAAGHRVVASDFSLMAELAYVDYYDVIVHARRDILHGMVEGWYASKGVPDAIIHLTCSPEVQLERIRERGRSFEQDLNQQSLGKISDAIRSRLDEAGKRGWRIVRIDTTDFEKDGPLPEMVSRLISHGADLRPQVV